MRKYYVITSPNGISINKEGYFTSKKKAKFYYYEWEKQFIAQGYYSFVNSNNIKQEIPLKELIYHCTFSILNKKP